MFNEYTPARTAVAEAWVHSDRIPLYASQESLGQAFNFDLLKANFNANEYKKIISHNLELSSRSGSSSTWVFSNHDVVRHTTRYGLPEAAHDSDEIMNVPAPSKIGCSAAVSSPNLIVTPVCSAPRATCHTCSPSSSYLYQGEELGLHEVVEIDPQDRQDPTFFSAAPRSSAATARFRSLGPAKARPSASARRSRISPNWIGSPRSRPPSRKAISNRLSTSTSEHFTAAS